MAKAANNANIERDESGPNFEETINLIRGKIRTNESDVSSLAQDNSTLYKRIEKQHGVHRGAAKDFAKIDKMAPEKRTDYLRSLLGLLRHGSYDNFNDLVDQMQDGSDKPAPPANQPAGTLKEGERVDLKTGMVVRDDGVEGEIDIRQATPEEMAAERERTADFSDLPDNVHHLPAGQKAN